MNMLVYGTACALYSHNIPPANIAALSSCVEDYLKKKDSL